MSDSAAAGSVQPDAAAAGNLASAQTPPDNGSAGADAKSWLEGLSGDNLKLAESKGWKEPGDIDKMFTSYTELEKLSGKSVQVPAEDAKPEEWDAYLSRLPPTMRPPESADKYEFKLPEGLPPDLPYDEGLAKEFKNWALEGKASNQTAEHFHNKYVQYAAEQSKAQMAQLAEDVETAHDDLVKEWGPLDSPVFKEHAELAVRGVKNLGLADIFKQNGILIDNGKGESHLRYAQLAKAFYAISDKMFREETIDLKGGKDVGPNPFAKGSRNITAISKLVKNDPDRAKRLCQEAGENWNVWRENSNPR